MSSERSAYVEPDSSSEVQRLRREFKLALEYRQASMMYAMRSMMTEFIRNTGRSEPGGAKGSVAVGESPAEVGTTAVGERSRGAVLIGEVRDTAVEPGIDRSEFGSAEGSATVGESPQGTVPTAVRDTTAGDDTILRDNALRNFVATGRGEITLSVEVGPRMGQPDQPGRAGERGPYLSGESGGGSTATAGGNDNSAKTAEGETLAGTCFKCGKKGHRVAN